ncbi:mechanosensitive ion channel family protein [Helicobacter cetorum]|uniref:mechanosensitive ion channel family protein n=1 Tax=Helicobacter cetorum TaxID=138563 RepID=UPI000CF15946|nr:mechanosensitive ion channel family protein [Helicobacter cetorum]
MAIRIILSLIMMLSTIYADNKPNLLVKTLESKMKAIDKKLESNDNVWLKKFENYKIYSQIYSEKESVQQELKHLKSKKNKDMLKINTLEHTLKALESQQKMLESYRVNPFKDLIERPQIPNVPNISNPIAIIDGISFIKALRARRANFKNNQLSLEEVLKNLNAKYTLLSQIHELEPSKKLSDEIYQTQAKRLELQGAKNILKTTIDIFQKDSDEAIVLVKSQIKDQLFKFAYVFLAALLSVVFAWILKIISSKYIENNERVYTVNKAINFINANIIILIFLFSYLENVTYLVTVLGFASAGLAIAMKDLFMSVLGWFIILIGGSVHVGDRVRVAKDGTTFIGDVLDISMLHITILEDVTLTSYMENRRAGRIIFVPNNYIFTTMFANYSHFGMKTVWDGIDFCVTFDSNFKKASKIMLGIATELSKEYTDITYKQLNKMRDKYSLRSLSVKPRCFLMPENNGVKITIWYQTNSYATMSLRSRITTEIIEAFLKEEDIHVAYTTTKLIKVDTNGDGFGDKRS